MTVTVAVQVFNQHNYTVEICGDGKNLGQVECDDGNTVSGDGCSSDCKVEPGFSCTSNKELLDTCIDIVPPMATLKATKTRLTIVFTEFVMFSASRKLDRAHLP